jgi:hypothetical protein
LFHSRTYNKGFVGCHLESIMLVAVKIKLVYAFVFLSFDVMCLWEGPWLEVGWSVHPTRCFACDKALSP